ncbi:uncharacterized protein NEMAJ01_0470 [Nematocida major]|uniref:uncharacterized protein n=1 Tax=Nematocida major TaxID=1912982 RepID=UPI002008BB60|nr:uncharacterized protein NEMAJ01_0470 [Nematocida major]KAH9385574.1 hypothetical protein NEMAJ01_0470 [Nematocida major]
MKSKVIYAPLLLLVSARLALASFQPRPHDSEKKNTLCSEHRDELFSDRARDFFTGIKNAIPDAPASPLKEELKKLVSGLLPNTPASHKEIASIVFIGASFCKGILEENLGRLNIEPISDLLDDGAALASKNKSTVQNLAEAMCLVSEALLQTAQLCAKPSSTNAIDTAASCPLACKDIISLQCVIHAYISTATLALASAGRDCMHTALEPLLKARHALNSLKNVQRYI